MIPSGAVSPRVDLPTGATVDASGHASQVAGIIAASWGNRVGIDGIAPIEVGIRARDTSGRLTNVLLPGFVANTSFANNLLELLRDPTVRVINASVGNSAGYEQRGHDPVVHGLCPPPLCDTWRAQMNDDGYWLLSAIQTFKGSGSARSNFLVTCSAGNARLRPGTAFDFESRDNSPCCNVAVRGVGDPTLPAGGAGADHFLAVEATNASGDRAYFSSGNGSVSAPGEDVYTTGLANAYVFNSGTSFSAPHVAGLALYLWALDPDLRHSDVRRALADPANTVAVPAGPSGGLDGARRIDAFAAALAIDDLKGDAAIRTALVDVDDGTADGNRRITRDVHGVATGEDPTFHTPDGRRGDRKVSIADFRAFRDALTQLQLADGTLGPGLAALDGEIVYAKRDLNGDGCVGVNPVPGSGVPDCAGAQPEATWSRFDFNGDGSLDRHGVAKVRGQDKTDLQVLADLWPADEALTDGWAAAALEGLLPDGPLPLSGSADLAIGTALPLGPSDPHDELRVTLTAPTRAITRVLRGPGAPAELVLTVRNDVAIAVKVEGFKAGAKVGDLCALIEGGVVTEVRPLKIGEDVTLELGPCTRGPSFKLTGRWWAFAKYDASTAPEIGEVRTLTYDDHTNLELHPQSLQTDEKACANLAVGQSCAYEKTLERTYSSTTVEAEVTRVADKEWVVAATMFATAKQPPIRPPPGTTCEDASISAECWSASEGGYTLEGVVDIRLPAPAKRRVRIACRAAGDEPPEKQLGYTQFRVRDTANDIARCASPSTSDAVPPGWSVDGEHVIDGDAIERLFIDFRLSSDVVAEYQHDSELPQSHVEYEGQVKVTMSLLRIVIEDLP